MRGERSSLSPPCPVSPGATSEADVVIGPVLLSSDLQGQHPESHAGESPEVTSVTSVQSVTWVALPAHRRVPSCPFAGAVTPLGVGTALACAVAVVAVAGAALALSPRRRNSQ